MKISDARVADILREARSAADAHGRRGSRLSDLDTPAIADLVQATLDYLRSRPGTTSDFPGWTTVKAMDAGVMPWWTSMLGEPNSGAEVKRLRPLRRDVYDYLGDELGLIHKEPGQGSSIEVSPARPDEVALTLVPGIDLVTIGPGGVGYGTPEQNKLVELAAMEQACNYFEGWRANDVSLDKCGWDITFSRDDEIIHAEVKGRSGKNPTILLTANEMASARTDPMWLLVIVTQALTHPQVQVVSRQTVCNGGTPYIYRFEAGQQA